MVNYEQIKDIALSCGFTHVGNLDANLIELRDEVRAACEENKCNAYGTNWSCPPACGTLSQCRERLANYSKGLILQTTADLEDSFDFETMTETAEKHEKAISDFSLKMSELYPQAMVLGAGACTRCKKCTYPDQECRFPEKMISSMEAYGIVVSDICKANDIPYYYGPNTLTYVGCTLIE